jgi:N6-L-threonylcarbamoyladenine synthase
MRILAIETSCDETAVALVDCRGGLRAPKFKVLENIVSSQVKIHRPFGGVVPNLAKREHIKNLPLLWKRIMKHELRIRNKKAIIHNSKFIIPAIDTIAVTVGPGLEPALWAGIEFAKDLAQKLNKPLIGANHMEGHLYSNWLPIRVKSKFQNPNIKFPAIALVVSGGHTILLKMDSLTKWKKLGETRDDAAGEAFDKIARLLGLPYPGGPEIQKLAAKGNPQAINFPRPMLKENTYEFSFSGLKTAVLYFLRDHRGFKDNPNVPKRCPNDTKFSDNSDRGLYYSDCDLADVAASAQQAIVDVLVGKTIRAAKNFGAESVLLCGGVSANRALRKALADSCGRIRVPRAKGEGCAFVCPDFEFNTDNAAMIAAAAYIQHLRKKKLRIEAQSNLNL